MEQYYTPYLNHFSTQDYSLKISPDKKRYYNSLYQYDYPLYNLNQNLSSIFFNKQSKSNSPQKNNYEYLNNDLEYNAFQDLNSRLAQLENYKSSKSNSPQKYVNKKKFISKKRSNHYLNSIPNQVDKQDIVRELFYQNQKLQQQINKKDLENEQLRATQIEEKGKFELQKFELQKILDTTKQQTQNDQIKIKNLINKYEQQIEGQQKVIDDQNIKIEEYQKQLQSHQQYEEQIKNNTKEKDDQIESLKNEKEQLNENLKQYQEQVSSLNQQIQQISASQNQEGQDDNMSMASSSFFKQSTVFGGLGDKLKKNKNDAEKFVNKYIETKKLSKSKREKQFYENLSKVMKAIQDRDQQMEDELNKQIYNYEQKTEEVRRTMLQSLCHIKQLKQNSEYTVKTQEQTIQQKNQELDKTQKKSLIRIRIKKIIIKREGKILK